MTAYNQNFTMVSGDSKTVIFSITDETGALLPLNGCTAKFKVKGTTISKDTTNGGVTLVGSEFRVAFVPSDTSALTGTFKHEGEITDFSNNVSTVFNGTVTIKESIV